MIQFRTLQSNLSEIYSAFQQENQSKTPSLFATSLHHLYDQGNLMGHVIKKLDTVFHLIQPHIFHLFDVQQQEEDLNRTESSDDVLRSILNTHFDDAVHKVYLIRQKRIWNHMQQIGNAVKQSLSDQEEKDQIERYKKFLSHELKDSTEENHPIYLYHFINRNKEVLSEKEERSNRHTIIDFHKATSIFWSCVIQNKDKLCDRIKPFLSAESTLVDRPLFEALKKERRWAKLEGLTSQSIPLPLLAKLYDPHLLTREECQCLTLWVKALNENQKSLPPKFFFAILSEIMKIFALQGSIQTTLEDVLYWLDQNKCMVIHQEDLTHIEWREKLRPGMVIECNGVQLKLGEQINRKEGFEADFYDTHKIYETDRPEYVIKIADNCFRLLLNEKKKQNEEEHCGLRFVQTASYSLNNNQEEDNDLENECPLIDRQGRFIVLERLFSCFDSYIWESQKEELTDEDEQRALVFANLIYCMNAWNFSFQNFSLHHFMWSREGELKTTHLLKKGEADYHKLEKMCVDAAKGNQYILKFLMNVSKLNEHPIALYDNAVVKEVLKSGKTDLISHPLPKEHNQEYYCKHIEQLCKEAANLRKNCFKTVRGYLAKKGEYSYEKEEEMKVAVTAALVACYLASSTPGRLSPHLIDEVCKSFSSSNENAPQVIFDAKKYYQSECDKILNYNKSIENNI